MKIKLLVFYQFHGRNPHYILQSMANTFLNKFIGKTQTISKHGPQELFKGTDNSVIYTHTRKSFDRLNTHPKRHKPTQPDETPIQFCPLPLQHSNESNFHLPHLEQKYLDSDAKHHNITLSKHGTHKVYYDKETNWTIDVNQSFEKEAIKHQEKKDIIEDEVKENLSVVREKYPKRTIDGSRQKRHDKFGGLGPNIGGQEWLIKREKKEKAMRYANELKRVNRQKLMKSFGHSDSENFPFRQRKQVNSRD